MGNDGVQAITYDGHAAATRAAATTNNRISAQLDAVVARAAAALDRAPIWCAAVSFVVVLQAALIFSHRPWFDEWQALEIALQSPTLSHLLENLRYEGHPPLWYLVLRTAALVVPTYFVLPVVAALLAAATQWVILFHAPFPRLLRLALGLNAFILFEYLTLSRSMTFGVACAVFAVALPHSRWRWLPIALLPMCDFLFGMISLMFIALEARGRGLWRPGIVAWLSSGAFAAWSVRPLPDMVQALELHGLASDFVEFIQRLGVLLVPLQTVDNQIQWNGWLPFGLGIVAGPFFAWFAWRQLRNDRTKALLLIGFLVFTAVFSVTVYPLHTRHLSLVALLLICLKWQDATHGRPSNRAFGTWLTTGALCGLFIASVNLTRPFNTSHLAADYITRHGLQSKHWIVWGESRASGVSGLLGIGFERLERNCTVSFARWDHHDGFVDWPDVERELRRLVRLRGRSYLLSDLPLDLPRDLAVPVAALPAGYDGYEYHLTLIGPDAAEKPSDVPSCVTPLRPLVRPTIWGTR